VDSDSTGIGVSGNATAFSPAVDTAEGTDSGGVKANFIQAGSNPLPAGGAIPSTMAGAVLVKASVSLSGSLSATSAGGTGGSVATFSSPAGEAGIAIGCRGEADPGGVTVAAAGAKALSPSIVAGFGKFSPPGSGGATTGAVAVSASALSIPPSGILN
jgi:hypothetical protein